MYAGGEKKKNMEAIKNYEHYNTEMEKALADKLFFVDNIKDCKTFIDFGCADGALLVAMNDMLPGVKLAGMDMDKEMLEKASAKLPGASFKQATLPEVMEGIDYRSAAINFSSVFHEVYSYCTEKQINAFWDSLNQAGYEYIVIRDMSCSVGLDEESDPKDVEKVYAKEECAWQVKEFEDIWGPITKKRNMIHFLLKYRYLYNWSREVRENYIPLNSETLLSNIAMEDYDIVYREEFILPFIKQNVYDYFGIELKDSTHQKIILKRKSGH